MEPTKLGACLGSALELIGDSPMVSLSRLVEHHGLAGRIVAKIEYFNPGMSKKDRIALEMIEDAERRGLIHPGKTTILELTSGNTGTGLSIVCSIKGYKFIAVMSAGNSEERARMMRAFGAEVVIVPQASGSAKGQVSGADLALVEKEALRLTRELGAFRADQFALESNYRAHFKTADEIWAQTAGQVDAFVDFVGSGGTFLGTALQLKRHSQNIKCFIVEPSNAEKLARPNEPVKNAAHKIQGGGYSMSVPETQLRHLELATKDTNINTPLIDGYLAVSDSEATQTARELARIEGIFGGFSGGANVYAAIQLLQRPEFEGKTIACLICDSGLKYLSTDLYE